MSSNEFERAIIVSNPKSTRRESIGRRIDSIRARFGKRVVDLDTYPVPSDTTDMLKSEVQPGDIIITTGGDGTARTAIEAMVDTSSPAHEAVLLPLPGGYRNDLSNQLHTSHALRDPAGIIEHADIVDLSPMKVSLERNGETIDYASALYAGIGAIAAGAWYQASPHHREHWMYRGKFTRELHSLKLVPWAMRNTRMLSVRDENGERELFDASIVNVPVIAKYLHPPVRIGEQQAVYMEIGSKSLRSVVPYVARLMVPSLLAPPRHEYLEPGMQKMFTVLDDTFMQLDGDAFPIQADTKVSFGLNDTNYRAYSTREIIS